MSFIKCCFVCVGVWGSFTLVVLSGVFFVYFIDGSCLPKQLHKHQRQGKLQSSEQVDLIYQRADWNSFPASPQTEINSS